LVRLYIIHPDLAYKILQAGVLLEKRAWAVSSNTFLLNFNT